MASEQSESNPNPTQEPRTQKLITNIRRGLAQAKDNLFPKNEKVPVEEINQQKVAEVILRKFRRASAVRTRSDMPFLPFNIVDVIRDMGYIAPIKRDYLQAFPEVYGATKQALWGLVQEGGLEMKQDKPPDINYETTIYRIVPDRLAELTAEKPPKK